MSSPTTGENKVTTENPTLVKIVNPPVPQLTYAEIADPHAKGIIYNGTMKPSIADKYKSEGYSFCIRSLNAPTTQSPPTAKGSGPSTIPLTAQETNRITGANDKHGYGLALMPVYHQDASKIGTGTGQIAPSDIASSVLNLLSEAAIPIGTTVWLQLTSTESSSGSGQTQAVEQQIFQSGYSVGILGNEVQQQQQTNGRVLESTYTPFEQSSSNTQIRTITIGDNAGSYPIYWAIQ
ncbi:glycoside hydrolase family 25 domain-containing protein [Pseudoalteromonas aurantia]|uniref:Uncharacterized protein n=1 Tax=Pseudoalteromonas aurantia 208 TaxID=1314867 RepID=A0ABR9EHP0_9GAMM|nr:hypothetical protein [Pseudoalteromonas aurantia]MBE0370515.1 hypothetical protein [Pseudoalteromonas aurantia 208]